MSLSPKLMNILERPCNKCGVSLEKGVRIVALADVLSGCALIILWSMVLNLMVQEPPKHVEPSQPSNNQTKNGSNLESDSERWDIPVLITLLTFAVVQFVFGIVLFVGQSKKNISILYTWLAISFLSIPANGLILKMYEMVVVYGYSYEIKLEAHTEALKKLKEHPHLCIVTTQMYPGPNWEQKGSLPPKVAFFEGNIAALSNERRPDSIFMLRGQHRNTQPRTSLSSLRH